MIAALLLLIGTTTPVSCATTSVQSELNDCALAEFNRADAALNRQWKITFRTIWARSSVEAKKLRTAQRAWISYRDSRCDADFPWDLGVSLDKMMNINCRTRLTIERTDVLKRIAKGI